MVLNTSGIIDGSRCSRNGVDLDPASDRSFFQSRRWGKQKVSATAKQKRETICGIKCFGGGMGEEEAVRRGVLDEAGAENGEDVLE